ncbi:AraC family transcriptional regulator [Shimia sp.]|uniref:helix-turn-helix transcriptional regulator n=1 Tax=Shimia sp. TaxID=1954381 RepID=UPI003299D745
MDGRELAPPQDSAYGKLAVSRIEDLAQAVLGSGLKAQQMDAGQLNACLAFVATQRMVCTTGLLNSKISLSGTLSETDITLGVGLQITEGSLQWLHGIESGTVGVFLPGEEHEALYMPGSLYLGLSLSRESLAWEAEQLEIVIDPECLVTGHHPQQLQNSLLKLLRVQTAGLHQDGQGALHPAETASLALETLISHLGRDPHQICGVPSIRGLEHVVKRAIDYINAHANEKISIEELALASGASRRTLHRAFEVILSDTPIKFINRHKLYLIRDLLMSGERASVSKTVSSFGVTEFGRFSSIYRSTFGETPKETARSARKIFICA